MTSSEFQIIKHCVCCVCFNSYVPIERFLPGLNQYLAENKVCLSDRTFCRVLVSEVRVRLISPIVGNIILNQIIQQLDTLFIKYTEAIEIWFSFLLIKMEMLLEKLNKTKHELSSSVLLPCVPC